MLFIGTAGWSIQRECRLLFPDQGTHLERYASRLNAAEINSSFHRPHQAKTYARWSACVPDHFRFSVKLPKEITHKRRFVDVEDTLDRFLLEATSLGTKLGPILIQLPPSFAYERAIAEPFFALLRDRHAGAFVFEPRHPTWFGGEAERVLVAYEIARVAADPAPVPGAEATGGWGGIRYLRLHGAPRTYYSPYEDDFLADLATKLVRPTIETWCIFDNTALGFAAADALKLVGLVGGGGSG